MLRCPFNNFSKCDGSCPFAMKDFIDCLLAVAARNIEGQSKGIHAQLVTANAHMVEMKAAIDAADKTADNTEAPVRKSKYADVDYLIRNSNGDMKISMCPATTDIVIGMFGKKVNVNFSERSKQFVLMDGTERTISDTNGSRSKRSSISVSSPRFVEPVTKLFGFHRYVFLKPVESSGVMLLVPTGEVADE